MSGTLGRRADAARNRERILEAAEELFGRASDPRAVTMGDLAGAAEVGRATLYRNFADVGQVALALLDRHEQDLQQALLSGPPPLGPGAGPADRLAGFYGAMVELLEAHSGLVLGAEVGQRRFTVGAYGFWRAHVLALLREAEVPVDEAGRGVLADSLLAPLDPGLYRHLRQTGASPDDVRRGWQALARRVLGQDEVAG